MSISAPQVGVTFGRPPADPAAEERLNQYLRALTAAGASPLFLPTTLDREDFDRLAESVDGWLFPGGGDVEPRRYGEPSRERLMNLEPERDERELALVQRAAAQGRPFLAICRGLQVVNVALGGDLIQDLLRDRPGSLAHESPDGGGPTTHPVEVDPSSRLGRVLSCGRLTTNSHHHQAVCRLGAGLVAVAHSPDGVVEALELPGHPFGLAVQWHPERMAGEPPMQALFRAFTAAAAEAGRHG